MPIEFEQNYKYNPSSFETKPKGITGWLIEKKIVRDESVAKNLMLIISIVFIVLAIVIVII